MQNLYFSIKSKNVTFVLEPKDLFYEHNGYLYYLIIYKNYNVDDSDKDTEWTFGLQFLKKYTLTFNRDDRVILYYKEKTKEEQNETNKNLNSGNSKYIVIIIVLSVIFLLCIAFLIYYIKRIKPRKIKVNELEEEYDYQAKDNNNFDNAINS